MELNVDFSPVADAAGVIRDSSPQTPPIRIRITEARVRTRTGCNNRAHTGRATFSGGATFDSGPQDMVDCEELIVPLDIIAPAFQETVMNFEIDGFDVGETVEVSGTLVYQPVFFFRDFEISRADAMHLPGFGKKAIAEHDLPLEDDAGARVNCCKSLVYTWFSLFDVRQRKVGKEISQLLADKPLVQFPDAEIRSTKEFLKWYDDRFPMVRQGYHEIETIKVDLTKKGARVELTPLLHADLANGQHVKMAYHIVAELVDVDVLNPKIKSYTATPIPSR